ncbi:sensitivity to red-light reduced protein [Coemansia sp. IMI 209127]|nr:sensitivity to red-light reduced protein [Coemansia sp. IMI 209127]
MTSANDDDDGFILVKPKARRGRAKSRSVRHSKPDAPDAAKQCGSDEAAAKSPGTKGTKDGGLCKRSKKSSSRQQRLKQRTQPDTSQIVEQQIEAIAEKKETLRNSEYFGSLAECIIGSIKEFSPVEIVCYGVGSLSIQASQWQLALILLINEDLRVPDIVAFDPVSADTDVLTYEQLGVSMIPVNEEAKRKATKRTLFYMPHCEIFLYENLLSANWTVENLSRIMLIGNSFQRYQDSHDAGVFAQQSPHIKRVLSHVVSTKFPGEKMLKLRQNPYAFTDTCLQRFELDGTADADLEVYLDPGSLPVDPQKAQPS